MDISNSRKDAIQAVVKLATDTDNAEVINFLCSALVSYAQIEGHNSLRVLMGEYAEVKIHIDPEGIVDHVNKAEVKRAKLPDNVVSIF